MKPLIALLAAACCASAFAQAPMYRSTMPDGKKVISDRPAPGAAKVEEMAPPPGNYAPGAPLKGAAKGGSTSGGSPGESERAKAESELKAARRAYEEAVSKAGKGKEEVEGDRIGTAKGRARQSEAYEKRQEALKAEVDAARKRLNEAEGRVRSTR